MTISLYNTMTRKKEPFVPIEEGKVRMYACGPTVYNYIHVGNGRMSVVFDVLRRYLEYRGFDVLYVQNYTDVDDKLIKAANELGLKVPEVAERFIAAYQEDQKALGNRPANIHPRVTEHIPDIIAFVEELIEKGLAYVSHGDVYFRVNRFADYGKLSRQSIDELRSGARVEVGEYKENPLDFALWKSAKPGEISWPSPWGNGRPGWHIECSVMAMKYLGETFDIHGGGRDLCFPHHENEIAQSEGLTGKTFANYWIHNGFVNVDNEKMSKSLGNFILVRDAIREVGGQVLRFFYLGTHYRNPINYSAEILEQAKNGLERLKNSVHNLNHLLSVVKNEWEVSEALQHELGQMRQSFIEKMDDDLNTADAISVMFDLARSANAYAAGNKWNRSELTAYLQLFNELGGVLGLHLMESNEDLLDEEIEALIQERNEARRERNFKRADEIRDQLKAKGILLEDTPQGVRWRREENR